MKRIGLGLLISLGKGNDRSNLQDVFVMKTFNQWKIDNLSENPNDEYLRLDPLVEKFSTRIPKNLCFAKKDDP